MQADRSPLSRRVQLSILTVILLCATGVRADQILENYDSSLTDYLYSGRTAVQDIKPLIGQRGVNIDGSARLPWPQGVSFAGNGFGGDYEQGARIGDVRVATGSYSPTQIDIAFPDGLVIGRSHNGDQSANSDGYQGINWFQLAQPEIVLHQDGSDNADDVLYIVYRADAFLEFKRSATDSTEFKGKNGTAGVVQFEQGDTKEPDTYTYYDQHGNRVVFFGFNTDADPAKGQFWKMIDPGGGTIYVGDKDTGSTAISSGYDAGGRITTAYDKASNDGRQYTFDYATIDGTKRLSDVVVSIKTGGTWASPTGVTGVAAVYYYYYQTGDNTYGDNGTLKEVYLKKYFPGTSDIVYYTQNYRYYKGTFDAASNPGHPGQIKYFIDSEGFRRADWEETGAGEPEIDQGPLTMSNSAIEPYASAYFEYDSNGRITQAWFNGECGCSGGADGTYNFQYETNGSFSNSSGYDTAWYGRTIVEQPDGVYATDYFDETGQCLSRVITDGDPGVSFTDMWVTEVVRNSDGQVTEVHSPENNDDDPSNSDGYTHSTGAISHSDSAGLVTVYDRVSSGDTKGFLQAVEHKQGNTGTAYYDSYTTYTSRDLSVGTINVTRPTVSARRAYHTETSTASTTSAYDETTYAVAWHGSTSTVPDYIAVKQLTATMPKVPTSENGVGDGGTDPAVESARFYRPDGTLAFTQDPAYTDASAGDKNYKYTKIDSDGLLTQSTTDTKTDGTFQSGDDPNTDFGITEASTGLDMTTTMTYDNTAQLDEKTLPSNRLTKRVATVLPDYRIAVVDIPRVVTSGTTTYYGPATYRVINQAGKTEFSGTIALSSSGTTTAPSTWIDDTDSDPITALALGVGSLSSMSTAVYSKTGARLEESRTYFDIPASGDGTEGTNYDATYYGYDGMGRRWRTKDPTGTIQRSVYDDMGRVTEQWIGTNDSSFDGGEASGTDNMVKASSVEYDSGGDGGNGYVTGRTSFVEDSTTDERVTSFRTDYRGRTIVAVTPLAPFTVDKYDNLGRLVASGRYSSSTGLTASTDPTSTTSNRVDLSETFYDTNGRVWKKLRHAITQATGADADSLEVLNWYDAQGRLIKTDGEQLIKYEYDRLGRQIRTYILANDDDTAYSHAADVTGDIVLEERQSYYDDASGDLLMSVVIDRHYDDYGTGETTGALDTDSDMSLVDYANSKIVGRAQITSYWYDDLDRQTDAVRYGTYGASSSYERDDDTTPPSRSDTALRTTTAYNDSGTVQSVTDPAGRERRFEYDDEGRRTAVIDDYVNGTPSGTTGDDDVYTRTEYTDGLRTKYWVDFDGDGTEDTEDEVTTYTYGVSKGTGTGDSKIAAGHLLQKVTYPDSTSGTDAVTYAYNAKGQQIYRKDQAGNEIETVYDDLGRQTDVKITTVATGFDSTIRRVGTLYDDRGDVSRVRQYDATSGGNLTDDVIYWHNSWDALYSETQNHITPAGPSGDYDVTRNYSKLTGGRNTLVLTSRNVLIGPSYSHLTSYEFNNTHEYSADAGRVAAVRDGSSTWISSYKYNGMSQVIRTYYSEPDVFSSVDGATAESYDHLDRFNRPTSSIWTKDLTTDVDFLDQDVTWDRNSNVTRAVDNIHFDPFNSNKHLFDESYSIDGLNRLSSYDRGNWSGSAIDNGTQGEDWTLDQVGNWTIHKLDLNGDGDYVDTDEYQGSRTHNLANELTDRDLDTDNDGNYNDANYNLSYDDVGDMTDDGEDYTYVYDPLGRLTEIDTRDATPVAISEYRYDGLNRRIAYRHDTDADGSMADEHWYHLVYDENWRIVAVVRDDDEEPKEVYVWNNAGLGESAAASGLDSVVYRDRDADSAWDTASDGTLEERVYYCQNWRNDVCGLVTDLGKMLERVKYDPYGTPDVVPAQDMTSDGVFDSFDTSYQTLIQGGSLPYDVRADLDMDGDVDTDDYNLAVSYYSSSGGAEGRGMLSRSDIANRIGYAGYVFDDDITRFAHVRHRVYDTLLGRWTRRDPAGYVDASNLYQYVGLHPVNASDPMGICASCSATQLYSPTGDSPAAIPTGTYRSTTNVALSVGTGVTTLVISSPQKSGGTDVSWRLLTDTLYTTPMLGSNTVLGVAVTAGLPTTIPGPFRPSPTGGWNATPPPWGRWNCFATLGPVGSSSCFCTRTRTWTRTGKGKCPWYVFWNPGGLCTLTQNAIETTTCSWTGSPPCSPPPPSSSACTTTTTLTRWYY